ncbi:hypothetical protein BURK2_02842 [Burkholderiales bacterium]|nr:hypothetical protein BURK2_02842 [Burkholderiales bacterium]
MALRRCPEGHTFDPTKSETCPVCGAALPAPAAARVDADAAMASSSPAAGADPKPDASPLQEDAGKLLRASAETAAKASQVGVALAGKAARMSWSGAARGARWLAGVEWGRHFVSLAAGLRRIFAWLGWKATLGGAALVLVAAGAWWWWGASATPRIVALEFPGRMNLGEVASGYIEYRQAQGGVRKVFLKVLHLGGRALELSPPSDGLAQGMLPLRLKASEPGINKYEIRLMDQQGRMSETAVLTVQVEGRRSSGAEASRGDAPSYGGATEGARPASGSGGRSEWRSRGIDLSEVGAKP